MVEARKEGRFPWNCLVDSTRVVHGRLEDTRFANNVLSQFNRELNEKLTSLDLEELIDLYLGQEFPRFEVTRWADQPRVCEIWIEKDALSSIISSWVEDLDIPIRVNRGYSSWTFIYNSARTLLNTLRRHETVVIYYLGDLDPSGIDIERSLESALRFLGLAYSRVVFRRLAITDEQVERYDLPPHPRDAETLEKLRNDPRTPSYQHEYVVELDALVAYVPEEFKAEIREAVLSVWDEQIYQNLVEMGRQLSEQARKLLEEYRERFREKLRNQLC